MNSNRKTSEPNKLLLDLTDKINLNWGDKYAALSNLSILIYMENIKSFIKERKKWNIIPRMEWKMWSTSWIIFCIKYSKLFWVYYQKPWKSDS